MQINAIFKSILCRGCVLINATVHVFKLLDVTIQYFQHEYTMLQES